VTSPVPHSPAVSPSGEWEVLDTSARPGRPADPAGVQFDDFYRRELPRLVALARALAGPGVADDLAQEAMLTTYRHWPHVAGYDSPEAWVRRICANLATSLLRRRAAEVRALVRFGSQPQPVALAPSHDAFWDHVRRLPRRQAQSVALRYVYDLELAEIARTLGCSEGSVKVHLSRARQTLAADLLPDAEESR
jgi:RNA polymerase sigma factor (sigma-70 family)